MLSSTRFLLFSLFLVPLSAQQQPHSTGNGYALPNGWTITPAGMSIPAHDMVLSLSLAPDGRAVIASQGGYNEEGLLIIDTALDTATQRVLPTAWYGLAWHPDGKRLFVSGGNGTGTRPSPAPIRMFEYQDGKIADTPSAEFNESISPDLVFWAGLVHHP